MSDFRKDYYAVLGISTSSTADDIKLAYRKQAKKYHPDLNPNNAAYEELIKGINEAYAVLGNKNERFAYDQYLYHKQSQHKTTENATPSNKKTYTKTTTTYKDQLVYVKGRIFIKYFGRHQDQPGENILREVFYNIKVTQVDAVIDQKEKDLTKEFVDIFSSHLPINLNINQQINCEVKLENGKYAHYQLKIEQLTMPCPEIIDVVKHEGESFGTITGIFYGYVKNKVAFEEKEMVCECFGKTGRTEQKTENGKNYHRNEYYNTNCTTYWGSWIAEKIVNWPINDVKWGNNATRANTNYSWKTSKGYVKENYGCFGTLGYIISMLLGLLFFLLLMPQLALLLSFILLLFILNLFPSKVWNWLTRAVGIFFLLIFVLSIVSAIRTDKKYKKPKTNTQHTVVKPNYETILETSSNNKTIDTLITHHFSWSDYNGKKYNGSFSVSKSMYQETHLYKENLDVSVDSESNYDKMLFLLKENDKNKLSALYTMFDSLKLSNKPNDKEFAEIVVTFVQSIPYTLVVPKSCNAQLYVDDFTTSYLSSPNARCDGYERFGINSPVEFIAYLNGDCDTRTLLLYTILSHYNYDVALLSSAYYSHSVLGVNLPYDGIAILHNNQKYMFWETTAPDSKPGMISNEFSNINYWRISLKSK